MRLLPVPAGLALRRRARRPAASAVGSGRYAWPPMPEGEEARAIVLLDLDGTLRGDVLPMVRLVRPLLPSLAELATGRAPARVRKLGRFLWNLARLWTLRALHAGERRRYKRLFSELHNLAGAMLRGEPVASVRGKYRAALPGIEGLWNSAAVELLRRVTARAHGLIVTGSEQVQTEECVLLLAERGVDVDRLLVHGSMYGHDPARGCYDGGVQRLNVTLDGKREALEGYAGSPRHRIVAAFGNSRPDRALFEAVEPRGLRVLVCPRRVVAERRAGSFVLHKLTRAGFRIRWTADDYLAALDDGGGPPVLATDERLEQVLASARLVERYAGFLSAAESGTRVG